MAKTQGKRAGRGDEGVDSAVHAGGGEAPKLIVEILPDVHAIIEGKPVAPGDTCELPIGAATNLVMLKHGKIVGTAE